MLLSFAFFPGQSVGSGFSLSGRPLGYNRVMNIAGSADFFCRKTRGIMIGGVKNSTKMVVGLWALWPFVVKHVVGEKSADPFGGRIVEM